MGGEREKVVEQGRSSGLSGAGNGGSNRPTGLQSTIIQATQTVRFHEKRVEKNVHFHVDADKLKTSVPTATWYEAWKKIQAGGDWSYVDHKNKTIMTVNVGHDAAGEVEAKIVIAPLVKVGPAFTELSRFTEGQ